MSFGLYGGPFLARHLHALLREDLRLRGRACGMRRCRRGRRSVRTRLRSRGMTMRGKRVLVNLGARRGCHSCCLGMYSAYSLCVSVYKSGENGGKVCRQEWPRGFSIARRECRECRECQVYRERREEKSSNCDEVKKEETAKGHFLVDRPIGSWPRPLDFPPRFLFHFCTST